MKPPPWAIRALQPFAFRLIELLLHTLRFEIEDRAGIIGQPVTQPCIFSLWHNRLLVLPYVMRRFMAPRDPTAIISASRDGALLADMIHRFGFNSVRGSRSRRGASAVLQLMEILRAGGDLAITPDGPRGPVYEINPGVVFLAQKSAAPVLALHVEFSRAWRLKSWDRFFIPQPFSHARVVIGAPYFVPPTSDAESFEAERTKLREALLALVRER